MPRRRSPPSYRLHKARGCAVVTIHGRNHYLGPYGSEESYERYSRLIALWRPDGASQWALPPGLTPRWDLTITEPIALYWPYAQGYCVKDGGRFAVIRFLVRRHGREEG